MKRRELYNLFVNLKRLHCARTAGSYWSLSTSQRTASTRSTSLIPVCFYLKLKTRSPETEVCHHFLPSTACTNCVHLLPLFSSFQWPMEAVDFLQQGVPETERSDYGIFIPAWYGVNTVGWLNERKSLHDLKLEHNVVLEFRKTSRPISLCVPGDKVEKVCPRRDLHTLTLTHTLSRLCGVWCLCPRVCGKYDAASGRLIILGGVYKRYRYNSRKYCSTGAKYWHLQCS